MLPKTLMLTISVILLLFYIISAIKALETASQKNVTFAAIFTTLI